MSMKSKIISNPNRKAMEVAYLGGEPVNKIAKRYGVSEQALYRHLKIKKSGMSRQIVTAMKMQGSAEASDLLNEFSNRIEGLVITLETALSETEEDKNYPVMIMAAKELRSCYESILRAAATVQGQTGTTNEQDRAYWEQKLREENEEPLHEMLKVLSPDEYELYNQLNSKMLDLDPNKVMKLKEKFLFEDVTPLEDKPESSDSKTLKEKDKP